MFKMVLCSIAGLLLASAPARAEITVTADRSVLLSRQECLLRVEGGDHRWRWSLAGPETPLQLLTVLAAGEARFSAPPTLAGGTFTVVVEAEHNASIRGERRIEVRPNPRLGPGSADALVTGSCSRSLAAFPGGPAASIAFCDGAFGPEAREDLRGLNRCWILAGPDGPRALALDGTPVALRVPRGECRAVAALPPGPGHPGAPRLVFALAGKEASRILALGADGTHAEHELPGPGVVQALALDRDGRIFVSLRGERTIWTTGAGGTAVHARLPEPRRPREGGILSLQFDPGTRDLYAGEAGRVWRVSPGGAVTSLLKGGNGRPRFQASHLALAGRELLILDDRRHRLHAFHLEERSMTALVNSSGGSPARLGPVHAFNPGRAEEDCAALNGSGPLAVTPEGLCLLGVEEGLATLDLPLEGLAGTVPAPAARTTRERRLDHWRTLTAQIQAKKKRDRDARRFEADEATARAEIERLSRESHGTGGSLPGSRKGMLCLGLLGLGALGDPALLGTLAQGTAWDGMRAKIDTWTRTATAGLAQVDPVCGPALLAGQRLALCEADYRQGVSAQIASIFDLTKRLFTDPSNLGAGSCLPGEPHTQAAQRIELEQSTRLSAFDALGGASASLSYELGRDGNVLLASGRGLAIGQSLAVPSGTNHSASFAGLVLGEVSTGLTTAGTAIQAVGDLFGKVSTLAVSYRGRYQRWANKRTDGLLNCTQATPANFTIPGPAPFAESPASALEDALGLLEVACGLAQQHLVSLSVCDPDTLAEFQTRNSTASDLYHQGAACYSGSILQGRAGLCPRVSVPDAQALRDTLSFYDEFAGEVAAAGYEVSSYANVILAGSSAFVAAANAERFAGNGPQADALLAVANGLATIGFGLFANGSDLFRIGFLARKWAAEVTMGFNAASLGKLDALEAGGVAGLSSSTGASSTGLPSTGASSTGVPSTGASSTGATSKGVSSTGVSSTGVAAAPGSSTGSTGGVEPLAGPALPPGTGSLPSLTSSATRARPFRIPDLIMAYLQWPPATP